MCSVSCRIISRYQPPTTHPHTHTYTHTHTHTRTHTHTHHPLQTNTAATTTITTTAIVVCAAAVVQVNRVQLERQEAMEATVKVGKVLLSTGFSATMVFSLGCNG